MNVAALVSIAISTSIVLLVIGIGLHSRPQDAISLIRQPGLLLRSVLSMLVVMPIVAAGLVVGFNLPSELNVALVALAMSPVPPLLPRKERKAGGHASYGIGLSVTMALLAIVTVPLTAAWLGSAFDREGAVAPLSVAKTVLATVLLPLAVGMALQRWMPELAAKLARPVSSFAFVLLAVSASAVLVSVWPAVVALFGSGAVMALAALAVIGLGVGHALGGPRADDRTVLALSTTSRHPAVALGIAAAGGVSAQPALAAVLLYVVVAILVSVPYVAWRKRVSIRDTSSAAVVRTAR